MTHSLTLMDPNELIHKKTKRFKNLYSGECKVKWFTSVNNDVFWLSALCLSAYNN
jgi:hypothetical protein